jgi:hypothetical protein
MGAPHRFIAWCKQEQASIEQQLDLLQAVRYAPAKILAQAGSIQPTHPSNAPRCAFPSCMIC